MPFYDVSIETTLKELKTTENGLSNHEVSLRKSLYGPNSLSFKKDPFWRKLIEPFANVFMGVLFVAVIISLFEKAYFDAGIILLIMLVSGVIYYIQQSSTSRILASLKKRSLASVEVVRDGEVTIIRHADLVPGDIVRLYEGDKVPADIRIIQAASVHADESVLTGESVPIEKDENTLHSKKAIYDQTNILFQGTFLTSGRAVGVVVATGNKTEFGRIAALSQELGNDIGPAQKKINALINYVIAVVGAIAIIAFFLALSRGISIAEALRFVIALSVSAIPESLPVAISIILVFGMRRMAAKKALVKTMQAIETVGLVTTIATDKTGTLTENKLRVQETWQPLHSSHHLATVAHRTINRSQDVPHDPLDIAMIEFTTANEVVELKGAPIVKLPFDLAYSMSGNIWHHSDVYELTIKGSPESILERASLTADEREEAESALHSLTSGGYRVIALATTIIDKPIEGFEEIKHHNKLSLVGFLGVADTLRPSARRAITRAQRAGITVRMITGDHFETAYQIGEQLGLVTDRAQVFDSRTMDGMSTTKLEAHIRNARVFSRVTPENKFRLLKTLKVDEITAMTGDGVNDVPALTNAHVGIAMGSGSQIAKDAGDIILLDNNFKTIIDAIREGRIIFSNIRRMLVYLLSTNTGEVLTTIGALAIGLPMPVLPAQILWINLVTDTAMVIPLGLEPGEREVMMRRPLSPNAPILDWFAISRMALIALTMAALALCVYVFFKDTHGVDYARTMVFCCLVTMQWANAFNARSSFESFFSRLRVLNKSFYVGLALAIALQSLALFGPLRTPLQLSIASLQDIGLITAISFALPIIIIELHKLFGRLFIRKRL